MTALAGRTAAMAESGAAPPETARQAIGFVLLTHAKPEQTLRLVGRLNALFGSPPIACHHDFGKCALDTAQFPGNVSFVQPHVPTGWAEFSLVEATLRALALLHEGGQGPEWTSILSGACYPVKPAAQILRDLRAGDYDAHIRFECVDKDALPPDTDNLDKRRLHVYHDRYCVRRFRVPSVDKRLRPKVRLLAVRNAWLNRRLIPFSGSLRCHAGSQWFSVNRQAAQYVLAHHAAHPELSAYYKGTEMADESYFQTILANAPQFKLHNAHWRYMDWSEWGPHPKALTRADVPQIAASGAHFARKVGADTDLLDALDNLCAVPA